MFSGKVEAMRVSKRIALIVLASLTLVACSGGSSEDVVYVTVTVAPDQATPEQTAPESPIATVEQAGGQETSGTNFHKLSAAYASVLANPPQLDTVMHGPDEVSTGYYYAIGEFTGDSRPDMLIMNFYRGHSPVTMVTTDENYQVIQATASLVNGAASAGGGRYEVPSMPINWACGRCPTTPPNRVPFRKTTSCRAPCL